MHLGAKHMSQLTDITLVPPNLAALGVRRRVESVADLLTIWDSPYPVITNYGRFCRAAGITPFNGGTHDAQGPMGPGYITSGYRDRIIEGRRHSPHLFGLAIDVAIGNVVAQVHAAEVAMNFFTRVGLYPDNGFLHLDLCPMAWMNRFGGRRHWVRRAGVYTSFDTLSAAITFALQE
jgi:hypothetical protein